MILLFVYDKHFLPMIKIFFFPMIDVAYDKLPMIDIRAYKKHFENFLIKKLPNNILFCKTL